MDCTYRDILESRIVTLFPRNMLHENTALLLHENTALLAENFRFPLFIQLLKKKNKVIFVWEKPIRK